jgi:hypothetical protein
MLIITVFKIELPERTVSGQTHFHPIVLLVSADFLVISSGLIGVTGQQSYISKQCSTFA